jgi:Tat protein secretion system quality control protein TatD with DNase activity
LQRRVFGEQLELATRFPCRGVHEREAEVVVKSILRAHKTGFPRDAMLYRQY